MTQNEKERVGRFINDPVANDTVYKTILDEFMSEDTKDVQVLAAAQLATLAFKKAWDKLEREVRQSRPESQKRTGQVGL